MRGLNSGLCKPANEKPEMGDEEPGGCAGDGSFKVFGQAAAAAEPREGALDHPSSRQQLEAFDAGRALDDLDGPSPAMRERLDQLIATINAIGEDVVQLGEFDPQALQQRDGAVDILDIGLMNAHGEQQAVGIGNDVALASTDALSGVEAAWAAAFRGRHTL